MAPSSKPSKHERLNIPTWRTAIQLGFVGLTAFVAIRHQFTRGPFGTVPLDGYCPMGGVVAIYRYVANGGFIRELSTNNFVMLAMLVAMGLIGKSIFCGWMCPFGTLQDWLAKLGRTLTGRRIDLPPVVDRPARYLKYVLLVTIVALTAWTDRLVFKDWDPFIALLHLGSGHLAWTAYAVLIGVLAASLFVERCWCKYLCPLAPVVGLIGKLSLIKVERNPDHCKECQLCNKTCPMGVDICGSVRISTVECNSCLECLAREPFPQSLNLRLWRPAKTLAWGFYPAAVVILFLSSIGIGNATGHWHRTKLAYQRHGHDDGGRLGPAEARPARDDANGDAEAAWPVSAEAVAAEQPEQANLDADHARGERARPHKSHQHRGQDREVKLSGGQTIEVRGNMTFGVVARRADLPVEALLEELKLAGVPPGTRIGRTMRSKGLTTRDVRQAIRRLVKRHEQ